ncbi:MAG TPA: RdgB/HAM1 family non-canonical purine NTP pyrophosphatase [bacterium]|nr:RdgB/HAM1 family non-canonical purine NTP pyrophosphatase [bacterium]
MIEKPEIVVLATRNLGKLQEIREILADWPVEWKSLRDYPACSEAQETAEDYLSNAREKAALAAEHSGEWALADDSGLEVEALGWKPGVRSARYAGGGGDEANWRKLLTELQGVPAEKRRAVFRCVVVLRHPDGREQIGRGELWGSIAEAPRGEGGFGYDPIFIPEGFDRSLAELSPAEKNSLSHRRRALGQLEVVGEPR